MDKRQEKRYKTRQLVKVCGKMGVLNDVSFKGIQISTALVPESRQVDISFNVYGEVINLMGVIQWMKRKQTLRAPNEMGIILTDAPPEYLQFVARFYSE